MRSIIGWSLCSDCIDVLTMYIASKGCIIQVPDPANGSRSAYDVIAGKSLMIQPFVIFFITNLFLVNYYPKYLSIIHYSIIHYPTLFPLLT